MCSDVKVLKSNKNHRLNLGQCHALPHPSNSQLFLVQEGGEKEQEMAIYQFDSQNNVVLQKPMCPV